MKQNIQNDTAWPKLGEVCRHFLLMSATPHNGKEQDFQLFMALLDGDRFEGKFRDGVHVADVEAVRRLTKRSSVLIAAHYSLSEKLIQ